jgi:tetratricopeptide (TPR) repeat protein
VSEHARDEGVLSGACGPDLLHLLTCAACRSWAIGRLLEAKPEDDEDETLTEYDQVFARLILPSAEEIEASQRRQREVEKLLGELMEIPGKRRLLAVRQERFRSLDLLDHLLEECHACQIGQAGRAAELAALAFQLAEVMEDEEEALASLPRALGLGANALRLLGDGRGAERRLRRAASFLRDRTDRAFHCRMAGLLRWEEGRADEASALFGHALKLYVADGLDFEAAACLGLLGLLEEEEGRSANALPCLARAWAGLEREARPVFALRVGLAFALCLSEVGEGERARRVLAETWPLCSKVQEPAEMLRTYWIEARVLSRIGPGEEALHLLEAVRPKLEEEGSLAEAALVSFDLALTLAEAGRAGEIASLPAILSPGFPARSQAETALREIAALAERREPRLRDAAARSRDKLLRTFRLRGLRLRPLPFA